MDEELERLKRRKLLELQQRMLKQSQAQEQKQEKAEKPDPKKILDSYFGDRAWEVYNAAWAQFPEIMPEIEKLLVEAIATGRIRQKIDGESLYQFFRQVGLPVRLQTTIRFKEHGELKTLEDKIKGK
jgi:DNA-binding TFAR19-related protein (PDSD5 family)